MDQSWRPIGMVISDEPWGLHQLLLPKVAERSSKEGGRDGGLLFVLCGLCEVMQGDDLHSCHGHVDVVPTTEAMWKDPAAINFVLLSSLLTGGDLSLEVKDYTFVLIGDDFGQSMTSQRISSHELDGYLQGTPRWISQSNRWTTHRRSTINTMIITLLHILGENHWSRLHLLIRTGKTCQCSAIDLLDPTSRMKILILVLNFWVEDINVCVYPLLQGICCGKLEHSRRCIFIFHILLWAYLSWKFHVLCVTCFVLVALNLT